MWCSGKPVSAVVEHVRDGTTLRVLLLPDFIQVPHLDHRRHPVRYDALSPVIGAFRFRMRIYSVKEVQIYTVGVQAVLRIQMRPDPKLFTYHQDPDPFLSDQ